MKNLKKLLVLLISVGGSTVSIVAMDGQGTSKGSQLSGSASSSTLSSSSSDHEEKEARLTEVLARVEQERRVLEEERRGIREGVFAVERDQRHLHAQQAQLIESRQEFEAADRALNVMRDELNKREHDVIVREEELNAQQQAFERQMVELAVDRARTNEEVRAEAQSRITQAIEDAIAERVRAEMLKNPYKHGLVPQHRGQSRGLTTRKHGIYGMRDEVYCGIDVRDPLVVLQLLVKSELATESFIQQGVFFNDEVALECNKIVNCSMPFLQEIDLANCTMATNHLADLLNTITKRPPSFMRGYFSAMKKLVLDRVSVVSAENNFQILLGAIANMPKLEVVSLKGCGLTLEQCEAIVEKITNAKSKVNTLILDENDINQGDAPRLVGAIHRLLLTRNGVKVALEGCNIDWVPAIAACETLNPGSTPSLRETLGLPQLVHVEQLAAE